MAALTKAQQAELDRLREEAEAAKALAWPNFPKPVPLKAPEWGEPVIHGWAFNSYTRHVIEQWRSSSCQYSEDPEGKKYASGSRTYSPIYATEQEAWLALYYELCLKYAGELAAVLRKAREEQPK